MALIKNQKTDTIESVGLQEANALEAAHARTKDGLQPSLNILRIEDPRNKRGYSTYALVKPIRTDNAILCDFVGFKVGKTQINALNSFEDVVNYVKKVPVKVVNIRVPWTKVINIENITYEHNKE